MIQHNFSCGQPRCRGMSINLKNEFFIGRSRNYSGKTEERKNYRFLRTISFQTICSNLVKLKDSTQKKHSLRFLITHQTSPLLGSNSALSPTKKFMLIPERLCPAGADMMADSILNVSTVIDFCAKS